jgi:hypothetical protein
MEVNNEKEANGGAEASGGAKKVGKERRRSPRLNCSGEAQMRIPPHVTTSKGEILDLSLEGCRIEFYAPQKIERNQRVELLFNVNNLPFHVVAVVRSKRSMKQFGFEFPQMIERIRVQLHALIEELSGQKPKPEEPRKPDDAPKRGRVISIESYRMR